MTPPIPDREAVAKELTDYAVANESGPKPERDWRTMGIVELAVENQSVSDYIKHWEGRAETAERALISLRCERDEELADLVRDSDEAMQKITEKAGQVLRQRNTALAERQSFQTVTDYARSAEGSGPGDLQAYIESLWAERDRARKTVDILRECSDGWQKRAETAEAERQAFLGSLELRGIVFHPDLVDEGTPWESVAEPEPQYFETLTDAIDFQLKLAQKEAEAERDELRKAASQLIAKLEIVHNDDRYRSVWVLAQIHGAPYSGPSYEEEMGNLRLALRDKEQG